MLNFIIQCTTLQKKNDLTSSFYTIFNHLYSFTRLTNKSFFSPFAESTAHLQVLDDVK